MSEVLKCAVCGQVIDQSNDIIILQKGLFCDENFERYFFL